MKLCVQRPNTIIASLCSKRFVINPEGYPVKRREYQELVDMVRADTEQLLDLLEKHGLVEDRKAWLGRWEEVWQRTLDSCDRRGHCMMVLS